jgi:thioredoxin 1
VTIISRLNQQSRDASRLYTQNWPSHAVFPFFHTPAAKWSSSFFLPLQKSNNPMTTNEFAALQSAEPAFMLYFYNDICGVCHVLWPKVEALMEEEFPKIKRIRVHANESLELAGQLRMLSVPGMLLFLDGREYFRANGMIGLGELQQKIARPYGLMFEG